MLQIEPGADHASLEHVLFDHHDFTNLRGNLYQLLAGAYLNPPSESLIRQLLDPVFIAQTEMLLGEDMVKSLQAIAFTYDNKECLVELQQEYMDLFVVPMGRYVTPFEDVYRGLRLDGKQERGPLLGDRAVAVKVFYRSAGADMDQSCKELPTHIGVELSFMSFLCEQEERVSGVEKVVEPEKDLPEQRVYRLWQLKFLHEHLGDWFPQLSQLILKNSKSSFYPGLAQFTGDFLEMDKQYLIGQLKLGAQITPPE